MLSADEYRIRLIDLPCSVHALVVYDEDGFPNIYLNSRMSREAQRKALRHELRHIARDDAFNAADIRSVEE